MASNVHIRAPMRKYFDSYAQYHRTRGNQLTHYLGIPLIVITLLGLLSSWVILHLGILGTDVINLDGGTLLWLVAVAWYLYLDWKIALPFAVFSLGYYLLGKALPGWMLWSGFVLGWALQFVGHFHFEKKSPAFLKNIEHLLIGPIFIFSKWVGYYRQSA